MWNETLQPELRLSEQGLADIAERTGDFSFTYLKELFISATMGWINVSEGGVTDTIMAEQVDVLREQMASAISFDTSARRDTEQGMEGMPHFMHHRMGRRYFSYGNFHGDPIAELHVGDESDFVEFGDDEGITGKSRLDVYVVPVPLRRACFPQHGRPKGLVYFSEKS